MRILICNDDGIEAPGLNALEEIARDLNDDVWIVAPETDSRCIAFPDAPTCSVLGTASILAETPIIG